MSKLGSKICFLLLATSLVALSSGCECDDPPSTILFVSPQDGDTINRVEDEDAATDGIQRTVTASAIGLTPGDELELLLDGTAVTPNATIEADGGVSWAGVTFSVGTHTLQARTLDGAETSDEITVTVDDACFNTTFVNPSPPIMGSLRLGPANDTDGEMCGETFEISVTVSTDAGDGATATIFVNGTPRGSTTVSGTTATFDGVQLGNRGADPNTIAVEVTGGGGGTGCMESFPGNILVDCMGTSCELSFPDTMSTFLNAADDTDTVTDGFQGEFRVTTGSEGVGEEVRLVIDGDESGAASATATAMGMGGQATFGGVELDEGVRRVQAICTDGSGNTTRSGAAEWTVDITPCGIAFTQPDADTLFTDLDDQDPAMMGIQIVASGSVTGSDCADLRVAECTGIDAMMFQTSMDPWTEAVTLSSAPTQDLCAEVVDQAGNPNRVMLPIRLRTDAPMLEITTPTTGDRFCTEASAPCTVDLDLPSPTCEAAFSVMCSDVGVDVVLVRQSTMMPFVGGTAPCVAMAGLPMGFNGVADFSMVSLPVVPALGNLGIIATQTVAGLTGMSSAITVNSDCEAPIIRTNDPMCGATLRPASDDVDPGTAGMQYDIRINNFNVPKPPVTLTFYDSAMMVIGTPVVSSTPMAGLTTLFSSADVPSGTSTIQACANDAIGNIGCSLLPCDITVADLPVVTITTPASMAVLTAADDCDGATAGTQIQVTATTDAADGSAAVIRITGNPDVNTTVSGGMVSACVDSPDGDSLTLVVEVTDTMRGTSSDSRMYALDSLPPDTAISDFRPTATIDRRDGRVQYSWTAVNDAGGGTLNFYEVRCSEQGPIDTEMAWTNATVVAGATAPAPGTGGTGQMDSYEGFRIGVERWCVIRGFDIAMQATPLPATPPPTTTLAFLEAVLTGTASQTGVASTGIGDLNGDGFDEILVGSLGREAYVFYGTAMGPATTPGLTIVAPTGAGSIGFGRVVADIGDINGDGVPDFALSARAALNEMAETTAGRVWIFLGRASWPSTTLTLSTAACAPADICLVGSEQGALFGWTVREVGQFDGSGPTDFAVGATNGTPGGDGRVYVILGDSGPAWNPVAGLPAAGLNLTYDVPGAGAPDGFVVAAPIGRSTLGSALATCGDLGVDGRTDIIAGARGGGAIDGALMRLDGRAYMGAGGLVTIAPTELMTLSTGAAGSFGSTVRCVGDVNNDGLRDIAAYSIVTGTVGGVRVFPQSGGSYGPMSVDYLNSGGLTSGDFYGGTIGNGWSPSRGRIGDLDNDMLGDMLFGSSQIDSAPGSAEIFYGRGPLVARTRAESDVTLNPTTAETTGVRTAAYVGDVNNDGRPDIAVGDQSFGSNAGRVVVYY